MALLREQGKQYFRILHVHYLFNFLKLQLFARTILAFYKKMPFVIGKLLNST